VLLGVAEDQALSIAGDSTAAAETAHGLDAAELQVYAAIRGAPGRLQQDGNLICS